MKTHYSPVFRMISKPGNDKEIPGKIRFTNVII